MNKPGVFIGILLAFVTSLASAITDLILSGFIPPQSLLYIIVYATALAYLIFLLKRSQARIGRVVTISLWLCITAACWAMDMAVLQQVLIQAGFIWLVRSLYFHNSIYSALLDLGLVLFGLGATAWAIENTGSISTAVWSFFLTQSIFCWIPERGDSNQSAANHDNQESFHNAHRVALDAVRKLTTNQPENRRYP